MKKTLDQMTTQEKKDIKAKAKTILARPEHKASGPRPVPMTDTVPWQ